MFGGLVESLNFVGRRAPETVVRTHDIRRNCISKEFQRE